MAADSWAKLFKRFPLTPMWLAAVWLAAVFAAPMIAQAQDAEGVINAAEELVAPEAEPSIVIVDPPVDFEVPGDFDPSFGDPSFGDPSFGDPSFELPSVPIFPQCKECPVGKPWWLHRHSVFAEVLYLRPGSADVIFAVEQTDPDPAVASPTGPVGITNIDTSAGYRLGFNFAFACDSSIFVSYTDWEGDSQSLINANAGNVLASLMIHPSTATSGAASLQATADQYMTYQLTDIGYRHLWSGSEKDAVNWVAALRYGNLEQKLSANQTVSTPSGLTNVSTNIDFDGLGIMLGVDGERRNCKTGMLIYGRASGSLLAGDWTASYRQTNQFGGGVVANSIEDTRVTPVLETEVGLGWQGPRGHFRATTGYQFAGWYNALTTRDYIAGVRSGQLVDIGETISFNGLVFRCEGRY